MKLSLIAIFVVLATFADIQALRPEKIRNLRALRPKAAVPARKLGNWLSEQVGNPYGFAEDDGDKEEQLHTRNMLMYMDISKKESEIKKLMQLVNEFPEHLDDFTEKINGMLSQISMAVGSDSLLKQKI